MKLDAISSKEATQIWRLLALKRDCLAIAPDCWKNSTLRTMTGSIVQIGTSNLLVAQIARLVSAGELLLGVAGDLGIVRERDAVRTLAASE